MIEGLKVTVSDEELRNLCLAQARFHQERAKTYSDSLENLTGVEGGESIAYSGGDPKKALKDKATQHENSRRELEFIAGHLKAGEEYLLDQPALVKIGIARSGW